MLLGDMSVLRWQKDKSAVDALRLTRAASVGHFVVEGSFESHLYIVLSNKVCDKYMVVVSLWQICSG